MRLKLTYEREDCKNIILPIQYNQVIQGLIYSTFSPTLSKEIHEVGFNLERRSFKLFTFSRIVEKGEKLDKILPNKLGESDTSKFLFFKTITFYFSSPFLRIVADFAEQGLKKPQFQLYGQKVMLTKIEVFEKPKFNEKILIKMLSPITIHSTLNKKDKKKISYYYKPIEEDFSKLIERNAQKKYLLIYKKDPSKFCLSIKPLRFSIKRNLCLVIFNTTPIESYTGIFELSGSIELIETTYEAGLGDRNSEGFGMWSLWNFK